MDIPSPDWTVADIDGDGAEELLIVYLDSGYHTVVIDNWTIEHLTYHFTAYDNFQYLQTNDGIVFLRHDYDDGEYAYTTFFTWNGTDWSESAQWRNFAGQDDGSWWAEEFYDDFWDVDGRQATQEEYNARVAPFLSGHAVDFNYMDPSERTLSGDAVSMMEDLNKHFADREGFIKSLQIDVNNDLNMDRIYLLCDAVNMWTNLQDPYLEIYGPSPMHTFRDRQVTLILAENYGDELRLRVQRMNLPYWDAPDMLSDANVSGSTLKIWDETYYYQEYYEPFVISSIFGDPIHNALYGLTREEVKNKLKDYEEWIGTGEGIAQGYLDGQLVQVWYASHYGETEGEDTVLNANAIEHYTSPYSICFDLAPDMDVFTIVRTIFPGDTISTLWTAVSVLTDSDGTKIGKTTCYYMHPSSGNVYLMTLLYPYEESDPMPLAFYAELIEDVPDSVLEDLVS